MKCCLSDAVLVCVSACTTNDHLLCTQAAYAKQWEEQVRKKQAELASRAAADPAAQQPGGLGAVKADGGWTTEAPEPPSQPSGAMKAEPKKEVRARGWCSCGASREVRVACRVL